jgi:hypothetical protein
MTKNMFTHDEVLNQIIPYRLDAIEALKFVLRLRESWDTHRPMKIYFDDRLQITGNSNAFMNPVIEAGVIHCRALLEFLGLRVSPNNPTKLVQRSRNNHPDDWGIEDFTNAAGALPLVTPQQAVSKYKGDPIEAEKALASVLHMANKGLAHLTAGLSAAASEISLLDIASHGVPALVISHLYTPLGLAAPKTSISSTRRDDC